MRRREILVFTAAFVVVLLGGAALAQVGAFSSAPDPGPSLLSAAAAADTTPATEEEVPSTTVTEDVASTLETATNVPAAATDIADSESEPSEQPRDDAPPKEEAPPKGDNDTTPPPLEILFPKNDQHFGDDVIAFEGTTEPGARVFAGSYEADVDEEGSWRIVLILSPGGNVVTFKAEDAAGNTTEQSLKVYLDQQEVGKEFTANQKWEVVEGHPAENKYYGTGTPGASVSVGSEYGDGAGKIGDSGEWSFYVEFPGAPCNQSFGVVVESGEHRREFTMRYVCAGEHEFTIHQEHIENTSLWTKFYGTGVPGDTIWAASDYGTGQTTVEASGEWYLELHLGETVPPNQKITVIIESSSGDRAEAWFKWVVEEKDVEFTANQKYGSCDSEIPWDKFWGTAHPGSVIEVVSPHGSGTTTADEAGNWLVEVEFPDAPFGEEFTVVIESSDGGRATFGFVRLGGDK
jgi:hypothetical protein